MATSPSPPSSAASKLFLVVAVALGVLATLLAFAYINSAGSGDSTNGPTIVIAKQNISPNMTIDPDRDLKTEHISAKFAAIVQGSLDWESRASYKGQLRVNRDIKAGQPILVADFAAVGNLILEKPYFAVTLPAETGMIIPGDYVRLIFPRPHCGHKCRGPRWHECGSSILRRCDHRPAGGDPALAVGGYLVKTRGQVTVADQYNSATANLKNVTLMVTEAQSRELVGAMGAMNSSQKAIMLICPSPLTSPPSSDDETPPASRAAAPAKPPSTATKP